MNSLREKLLKAGLVSEEEAMRAEAERKGRGKARSSRRSDGAGRRARADKKTTSTRPKEERLTPEELAAAETRRLEHERRAALEREREENRRRAASEQAKARDVRRVAEYLGVEVVGEKVFHFTTRKGKLQRMYISPEALVALEKGELAIIEHPLPHAIEFAAVPREGAEAVLKIEPRAVRFFNRSDSERYGIEE